MRSWRRREQAAIFSCLVPPCQDRRRKGQRMYEFSEHRPCEAAGRLQDSGLCCALLTDAMNSRRLIASPVPRTTSGIKRLSHFWIENCVVRYTQAASSQRPLWVKSGHRIRSASCPLYPQKRTLIERVRMSALCQKRTFRLLLDIIVGGQGCSSSWCITRETSPPEFSASGCGRCCAAGHVARCIGTQLPNAAGALDRWVSPWWRHRHLRTADGSVAIRAARPAIHRREPGRCNQQCRHRDSRARSS